jgi:predicted glutamine amidotransferase
MCLIILKEEGQPLVPNTMINEVWIDNPHGAGIIFKRNGKPSYQMVKGLMDEEQLYDTISKLKLTENDFIAYHLRWATSGEIDQKTTHPFIVHEDVGVVDSLTAHNSDKTLYVMHNGVIYDLNDKKAKKSDTVRFVSEYLSQVHMDDIFHNEAIIQMIEKFIDGSRLFLAHSKYGRITYGEWHMHNGYQISKAYEQATKSSQAPKLNKYSKYGQGTFDWDWDAAYTQNDSLSYNVEDDLWCDWCGRYDNSVVKENVYNGNVCKTCKKEYLV